MFLSFDGIDGVGKSTQLKLFVEWLAESGREVVTCRDPGSTAFGEALRDLLLYSGSDRPIGPVAEMLTYMAARAQLVEEVVRPALEGGKTVVSDRFLLANVVYQGYAGGLDREDVVAVGRIAVSGVEPDHTFLLDMDPAEADRRRGRPADRMESRGVEYRRRLRAGFLAEAERDADRISVIDAGRTVEEVQAAIRGVAERLGLNRLAS